MPSILAFILCTVFVLLLIRLDKKQYPDASFALWVPSLWMLMNASKPLGIWFGAGGTSMEEGSSLDRTLLIILALIGIIILLKRNFSWTITLKYNASLILLLTFMLVSVLWSSMPFVSLKRWSRELIAVIMACVLYTESSSQKALVTLFRRVVYILIPFSYLLIHYYPHLGREYNRWSGGLMWIGVATQKNGLALLCLFSILFLGWSLFRRLRGADQSMTWYHTYVEFLILAIALWLFMGPDHTFNYSATSTSTLVIVSVWFIGLQWLRKRNVLIGAHVLLFFIVSSICFGTLVFIFGGLIISDIASIYGRNETLTGRTDIWAYLLPYVTGAPFLGHGFGGFWTDAHREATSSHAHNGYLDIVLNMGFLGLLIFSAYLIQCCRKAVMLMNRNFDQACLWACLLIIIVVHNIAESTTTSFTGILAGSNLFMYISARNDRSNDN